MIIYNNNNKLIFYYIVIIILYFLFSTYYYIIFIVIFDYYFFLQYFIYFDILIFYLVIHSDTKIPEEYMVKIVRGVAAGMLHLVRILLEISQKFRLDIILYLALREYNSP